VAARVSAAAPLACPPTLTALWDVGRDVVVNCRVVGEGMRISKADYFSKSKEFRTWLKRAK